MPVSLLKLKQGVTDVKKTILLLFLAGVLFIGIAGQNMTPATGASSDQAVTYHFAMDVQQQSASGASIIGSPSISAAFINRVLSASGSPAAGTGAALYSLGVQYDIDPVYALAFFHHESSYGTTGEATVTRSLGNERCIADRPCNADNFAVFTSWVDGYQHWYYLLYYGYIKGQVAGHRCETVEQIIPVYAPSSDGNSESGYIKAVEQDVATWRAASR